ncbi:MAG: hypothetical protein M3124_08645, partial [Actinomycetota bacterium]|nr:hypothetical protein [Actinomycetota bacterium]
LWAGIAVAIAIGRWDLVASAADLSPWILVAALACWYPRPSSTSSSCGRVRWKAARKSTIATGRERAGEPVPAKRPGPAAA